MGSSDTAPIASGTTTLTQLHLTQMNLFELIETKIALEAALERAIAGAVRPDHSREQSCATDVILSQLELVQEVAHGWSNLHKTSSSDSKKHFLRRLANGQKIHDEGARNEVERGAR